MATGLIILPAQPVAGTVYVPLKSLRRIYLARRRISTTYFRCIRFRKGWTG